MKKMCFTIAAALTGGLVLVSLCACSFSASSRSSSSPSRSSSRSSRHPQGAMPAAQGTFQEEIAAIAVLYANSGGTAENFQREIGAAAARQGVPAWENDRRVFVAIGRGLQRAGVKRQAIPNLPFLQGIRNARHFDAVIKGS